MRLPTLFAGLIACLVTNVTATALTYKLAAHEKACFYAETKKEAEKVAFYFAVCFSARISFKEQKTLTIAIGAIWRLVRY